MGLAGKAVVLHGPSSTGKSTLARALQARIERPFWHYSIDHFRDSGMLPTARLERGDFRWADMREPFFEGFHRTLPALLNAGNNLIVEHIVETDAWMTRLIELLRGQDVFFVSLVTPLAELERRERVRGDRLVGDARRDLEVLKIDAEFDLVLDSTEPLEANVEIVLAAWRSRASPSAFERMAGRRAS